MTGIIKFLDYQGNLYTTWDCVSLKLEKDVYTPYSSLEGVFVGQSKYFGQIIAVQYAYGTETVFEGIVDSIRQFKNNGIWYFKVSAKSNTIMLCQNQTTPGMRSNLNLIELSREFSSIPRVFYQVTSRVNYIYITDGSTMWDAIVNFTYRLNQSYPYVSCRNMVMTTPKNADRHVLINEKNLISTGIEYDNTRLISKVDMQDIDGKYNAYTAKNESAIQNNIVREKQIHNDLGFMNDPQFAVDLRVKYSQRGRKCTYGIYSGYCFEDLFDLVTIDGVLNAKRIHKVVVTTTGKQTRTYLGTYEDGFYK